MELEKLLDRLTNKLSVFAILNGLFVFSQSLHSTAESKIVSSLILVLSFFIFFSIVKTTIKNYLIIHIKRPNVLHFEYSLFLAFLILIFVSIIYYYVINSISLLFGCVIGFIVLAAHRFLKFTVKDDAEAPKPIFQTGKAKGRFMLTWIIILSLFLFYLWRDHYKFIENGSKFKHWNKSVEEFLNNQER